MNFGSKDGEMRKAVSSAKVYFAYAALFSFFINVLMLVPAIYMLQVYDRVVSSGSVETLIMLTLIAVLLFSSMGGLEWVRSRILVRASVYIDQLLGQKVFDAAFKQSLYSGGRASIQPLNDLNGIRQFLTGNSLFAFFDAPWVPVYLFVMYLFHPLFGLMGLIAAIYLFILTIANEKSTHKLLENASKEANAGTASAASNLRNAEVIESMGMLATFRERWQWRQNEVLALQAKASDRAGIFASLSKVSRMALQSLALGLGAYLAINLEISPGMMIAGSIMLGRALAPIDQMIGAWKGLVSARSQFNRLDELLGKMPDDTEPMPLPEPQGNFSAENLMVAPPGTRQAVLSGVNITINKGEVIGIVGPSGAGKSTFARALLGIWPAMSGKIRLDGADIFQWDREALGQHIGYLPQDIELFDGTISENIARFYNVDPEKVVAAAQAVGVHELILALPKGYDTVIGVSGGALSGGQRQRIGLARAMYDNPAVLVLDEPNSNLDDEGEKALFATLQKIKSTRSATVVIISHKPGILAVTDKVLVLKDGQVAAFDTTQNIMAAAQPKKAAPQVTSASSVVTI